MTASRHGRTPWRTPCRGCSTRIRPVTCNLYFVVNFASYRTEQRARRWISLVFAHRAEGNEGRGTRGRKTVIGPSSLPPLLSGNQARECDTHVGHLEGENLRSDRSDGSATRRNPSPFTPDVAPLAFAYGRCAATWINSNLISLDIAPSTRAFGTANNTRARPHLCGSCRSHAAGRGSRVAGRGSLAAA